ncbi:vitelline membrane outer layer protein 1-like [Mercenaria mercenaria]|uniref:vitelline membrane outer layer protein 1-like n=1 Tax=Mercenaria mercenaria TaxID=6596 RepID=UPI00234F403F|nr:vitelline membrane outer layer protein 1-like [Mercenaria mercenaria]
MPSVAVNQILVLLIILHAGHCFLVSDNAPRNVVGNLGPTYRIPWGTWGRPQFCAQGSFAIGYEMKIQRMQLEGDDTALNAVKLVCQSLEGHHFGGTATSTVGLFGNWGGEITCKDGFFLKMFALQAAVHQQNGDDTAANYVKFKCQDFASKETSYELAKPPGHGFWGTMGSWSKSCPANSAICGIRTKVDDDHHGNDKISLTDVEFYCCDDDSWK